MPVIGNPVEFATVNEDDVRKFYQKFYVPNNAVLVLGGNFDTDQAKQLVEKYYGGYERRPLMRPPFENINKTALQIVEQDKQVQQDIIYLIYTADSFGQQVGKEFPAYADMYSFMLAGQALGGSNVSRLYKKLVREKELAVDVSASYSGFSRGPSLLFIAILPKPGVSQGEIIRIVQDEVEKMAAKGINDKELNLLKDTFLAEFIYDKENIFSVTNLLGTGAMMSYDVNEMEAGVRALNSSDIKKVLRSMLENASRVIAISRGGGK